MLRYQNDRLEQSFIPNVRLSLNECDAIFSKGVSSEAGAALQELWGLRNLVFQIPEPGQSVEDKHSRLVLAAYRLRKSTKAREPLYTSSHSISKTKKLWEDICFLGRLGFAFDRFKEIAAELPSFSKVCMTLVPRN